MDGADSPVKRAILGENSARIYGYTPARRAALATDKVAHYKRRYDAEGGDRSNMAYGYVLKNA